ncbi:hypothetical protein EDB81DRAFT_805026 [Dactylonectria macrodidyma]|uniref:Uncharacterized protein n=1 Tax=Dactylonectria macrodidyma TaxID=307937 RepID=A0A9P9IVD6_9HYPO|nr:hypothetical protein EDB81DRAFT_805026 [Dactylonectria macrodidyma]
MFLRSYASFTARQTVAVTRAARASQLTARHLAGRHQAAELTIRHPTQRRLKSTMAGREQQDHASSEMADAMLRLDMTMTEHGTPLSKPLAAAARNRRNISTGIQDHILYPGNPKKNSTLWIVDRIMEPQTIPRFMELVSSGLLPDGTQTSLPLPTFEEMMKMMEPMSTWAPAPYNQSDVSTMHSMSVRIGSHEDPTRLVTISKELHFMKSRIWDGIVPMSERRWKDLDLDHPDHFAIACQFIVAVINVFHYLNHNIIKDHLRETSNLISDHLKDFDEALNATRKAASPDGSYEHISVAGLWHEYVSAHYKVISNRSHSWVVEHIDRLREPILAELASYQPAAPGQHDAHQWNLTNKLHDLLENGAQADYVIFIPTDGYRGDALPAMEARPLTDEQSKRGFREEPIAWNASLQQRQADYVTRLRFLSRVHQYNAMADLGVVPGNLPPMNDPSDITRTARAQVTAQAQTRLELRGEPEPLGLDLWLARAKINSEHDSFEWGYVAYRLNHEHNEGQWAYFKERFEADSSDWCADVAGIDELRSLAKIHWLDGKELGIEDGDIDAAKKHFKTYLESESPPKKVRTEMFLVADGDAITSYIKPTVAKSGFITAVDADFDPNYQDDRIKHESPGYSGSVRVLGRLLWDDVGAMYQAQNHQLVDLWPLAMNNPALIYEGPMPMPILKAGYKTPNQSRSLTRTLTYLAVAGIIGNYFFGFTG